MLKKYNRLSKNNDFDNVFKNGRGVFLGFIGVRVIENHLPANRFGVLVGAKVSKTAVWRNKIKRRIREALKYSLPSLFKGFDIVVTTAPMIRQRDFTDIKEALADSFKRLKIFKNDKII